MTQGLASSVGLRCAGSGADGGEPSRPKSPLQRLRG